MTRVGMVTGMPYERRGVDTSTPEARQEITDAVADWLDAQREMVARRDARDAALRRCNARGVDPRDLHRLVVEAGWTVHVGHIKRIVKGARPSP